LVECVGSFDESIPQSGRYANEYVVIKASRMIERIYNAENIPDFIVSSLSYLTFGIFNLNPPIECISISGDSNDGAD
jgi:hypothetical protein